MRQPPCSDDVVADQRMHDRGARTDRAVAADLNARPDHRGRADHGPRADRRARADHRAGIDRRRRPRSPPSDARSRPAPRLRCRTASADAVHPEKACATPPRNRGTAAPCAARSAPAGACSAKRSVVRQTPARVAASRSRYLVLSMNTRSEDRARSSAAMPVTTTSSRAPSRGTAPVRSAISRTVSA